MSEGRNSAFIRICNALRRVLAVGTVLLIGVSPGACSLLGMHPNRVPLTEPFDGTSNSFPAKLVRHPAISMAKGDGVGGSDAIRVTYEGSPQGSERVIVGQSLPWRSLEVTLAYDVKFCEDFQFVKGGKLHGLGPAKLAAGGRPVAAGRWSARVAFLPEGGIATYLYHQDLPGRYGDTTAATSFKFEPGRYHSIALYVRLNDPPEARNGRAELFVDGRSVLSHENIRFRSVGGNKTLIQKLLFNTFHGGHTPDYAPRRVDGTFSRECGYFDNFAVYPYFHVKQASDEGLSRHIQGSLPRHHSLTPH